MLEIDQSLYDGLRRASRRDPSEIEVDLLQNRQMKYRPEMRHWAGSLEAVGDEAIRYWGPEAAPSLAAVGHANTRLASLVIGIVGVLCFVLGLALLPSDVPSWLGYTGLMLGATAIVASGVWARILGVGADKVQDVD